MHESKRARKRHYLKKRMAVHWRKMLRMQLAAYGVVLLLWGLPLPNPIKLLAVTFHELSHALAGVLTGGRFFGYAIAPGGSGVTMGVGGSMVLILVAGYAGSCLWGVFLYYMSVRWQPNTCLLILELLVMGSAVFGWLNNYTILFGFGAIVLMTALFRCGTPVKVFFVRLVGSACCFYAPLEVMGELFSIGGAPSVKGAATMSDVAQLSDLLGINIVVIALVILVCQAALLVGIVRWACRAGAHEGVRAEISEHKRRKQILRDIRAIKERPAMR